MGTSSGAALVETLAKVGERITQFRERGEHIAEQNTKAILIEPVLAALGWRLDELDDVQREYRFKSQDNPVDYALFVFGARAVDRGQGAGLRPGSQVPSQALYYANVAGIAWCVLTNGDEYRIYCSREMGDVEEKLFRSMRVTDPDTPQMRLVTLELIAKDRMGGPPPTSTHCGAARSSTAA